MNKRKIYIPIVLLILFLLIFWSGDIKAIEKVEKKIEVLSLDKFIKTSARKDTHFKEILIENLKLNYKKDLDLKSIDVILSALNKYKFAFKDSQNSGFESSISLSTLFPQTATNVSVSYGTSPGSIFTGRTSAFSIQVSQAIAKNAFGYGYRLDKKILDLEIALARHQVVEAYEDYLSSLIGIYYQWYSNYTDLKTAKISLRENKKLLINSRARKRYNIAYQRDVDRIMVQVLEKEENLISLQSKYNNTEQLVYQAIRYNGKKSLVPEFSSYKNDKINFDEDYKKFVTSSRTHAILNFIEKKGTSELKKYAHNMLPSVDLLFGYERTGKEYSFQEPDDSIFAGFSFDFSFLQTRNRASFKTSKIEKKRLEFNTENTKIKLLTNFKNLSQEIELEKKLITSAEEKIKLGKRILVATKRDYRLAKATLTELIEAINKLEKSKFDKVYHRIKLNTLKVEWLRLMDRLVTKVK